MLTSAITKKDFSKAKDIINKNKINKNGREIIYAVRFDQPEIVDLLIKKNVNLNIKDIYGKTALSWAIELKQQKVAMALILAGALSEDSKEQTWWGH